MMLLGLLLHSMVSFTATPLGDAWPYQDAAHHTVFDVGVFLIHVFRMPLFFLMAGFFAAFLYFRRGAWPMLRNRTARVALPFVVFLALLFPITSAGFVFTTGGGVNGGWSLAAAYLLDPRQWLAELSTIHLWFLYYLLLFYAAILIVGPLGRRLGRSDEAPVARRLGAFIHHPVGFVACCAITFVTLLPMEFAGLDTETTFLVQPKILVAYGVFVMFGWLLYVNREHVDGFARRAWPFTIAGLAVTTVYLAYVIATVPEVTVASKALAALAMWTLIYGIMGLFVRYYDRPRPMGRYLADASYWLYLTHLPFAIWTPGLMNGWAASPFAKSAITLAVTTIVTLTSYHFLVRSTAIGALLNGRRYPRALPRFEAQETPLVPEVPAVR